jgi:hypothetical protein
MRAGLSGFPPDFFACRQKNPVGKDSHQQPGLLMTVRSLKFFSPACGLSPF